jgi:hypothetical protein
MLWMDCSQHKEHAPFVVVLASEHCGLEPHALSQHYDPWRLAGLLLGE